MLTGKQYLSPQKASRFWCSMASQTSLESRCTACLQKTVPVMMTIQCIFLGVRSQYNTQSRFVNFSMRWLKHVSPKYLWKLFIKSFIPSESKPFFGNIINSFIAGLYCIYCLCHIISQSVAKTFESTSTRPNLYYGNIFGRCECKYSIDWGKLSLLNHKTFY